MHHKHGTSEAVLIVFLLLSSSLIVFSQNAQAAAGSGSQATTFYLHDDQHGFGHPGKRYDWANTSLPYNPLNPYFISSKYQGILLNNSPPYNSFRWIVSPSVGVPVALNGTVSVQLYLTPSNTSTGVPVNLSVTLQNLTVTSGGASIEPIAHNYTGGIFLSPNELVNVTMKISKPYLLSANSSLVLNVTRNDSNSLTSVYVEFDYNSTPSNFRVSMTPRISSAVMSAPGTIYDNQSFPVLASVTDSLGHQDIAHVMLSAVNATGVHVISGIMMTETTYGRYVSNFSADIGPLPYGNYSIKTIASTVSSLSGGNELFYQNYSVTVQPSLSSFAVSSPARANAGVPFAVNATAVADNGLKMASFNGTADVQLISSNGTVLSPTLYSPHSAVFASGFSQISINVTSAGNFSAVLSSGTASGRAYVIVVPGPVSSIAVLPSAYSMLAGATEQFTATARDSYGNVNTTWVPVWTVTGGLGNISSNGTFTASAAGIGRILATDAATGATGYANISVSSGSLFSIQISPSNETLLAGQSYFFHVSGFDAYGNSVQLLDVIWSTNAGTVYSNGSYALLNATKTPLSQGYIEAYSAGLTAIALLTIVPSAFSPQFITPFIKLTEPSGQSWSLNISAYVTDPNDPTGQVMEWFLYGGATLFYTYGSGVFGNTRITFIPYPGAYGQTNATLVVINREGYSSSAELHITVLPRPEWINSLPLYMSVQAGIPYSLNYTYFIDATPYPVNQIRLSTSSSFVYDSGLSLTYLFPVSIVARTFPVVITATNPGNLSASLIQLVSVVSSTGPSLNTRSAPPSFISVYRGENVTLASPLSVYFSSARPLHFSIVSSGVSTHISGSGLLYISAPENPSTFNGTVLVQANNSEGEYAFLFLHVGIVDIITPPVVKGIPIISVHYSSSGVPDYSLPLLQYVLDSYVPLYALSVLPGSGSITFSRGNFSLLFSMPANVSGGSTYVRPYWLNTTLLFVGGPLSQIANDSVSVALSVYVSSNYPPAVIAGASPPSFLSVPENGVSTTLNLSHIFYSPQGSRLNYSGRANNLSISISQDGLVTVKPEQYFFGSVRADFVISSDYGFIYRSMVVYVYPVYIPPVISVPGHITTHSAIFIINLSKYIVNHNNVPLTISASGIGVTAVGTNVLVSLPSGSQGETITLFFVTPQGTVLERTVTVQLVSSLPNVYAILFYALLFAVILLAALLTYKRLIPRPFQLSSVLLIHNDGRLVSFGHGEDYRGMDRDLIVGMFTAIQDFVSTSFPEMEGAQSLNRIELGKYSIAVERGRVVFILSIYSGEPPRGWFENLRATINGIERKYQNLDSWDGRQESVEGIDEMISSLFGST
jgi:hypothetical protein